MSKHIFSLRLDTEQLQAQPCEPGFYIADSPKYPEDKRWSKTAPASQGRHVKLNRRIKPWLH